MTRSSISWVVAGLVVLGLSARALGDPAADYKAVFGEEEKSVLAGGARASADFAAKLLDAAKGVAKQPDFQALLYEKAYEFGMKEPAGYSSAIDAMKLLASAVPDKKPLAQKRILEACELRLAKSPRADRKRLGEELIDLWLAAGDEQAAAGALTNALASYNKALEVAKGAAPARAGEVSDKIKQTTAAIELEAKLANLRKRLKDSPKSVPTRTSLILAYLGEADDPAEAAKLLSDDLDAKFRTYLPLAARPVGELAESACWELANWYPELAEKVSSPAGKSVLLGKARACGERFLELHTDPDATRLKGTVLLEKIDKALSAANPLSSHAATNLLVHYTFDEKGNKVLDKSGNGNHGMVYGATWTSHGKAGGAYDFDGKKDYIELVPGTLFKVKGQFSVCAWVYVRGQNVAVLSNYHGGMAYAGQFFFTAGPGSGLDVIFGQAREVYLRYSSPSRPIKPNEWRHVAFSYDEARGPGNKIKLYVDGKETGGYTIASEGNGGPVLEIAQDLRIMAHQDTRTGTGSDGLIDEVMVFRCALSAAEIRQIYLQQGSMAP
ncbi:MAG: LamG domain-containing protein [Planctomycetota bacterium]|nr:LamG domain-containing protein [Planctomycetota bacterium]